MSSTRQVKPATIANGTALSDAVELGKGQTPVAIQMPAAWTAAGLSFQVSIDGNNFKDYYFEASEFTVGTIVADSIVGLDPAKMVGVTALKVRSGTTGTPVNQGAERILEVVVRGY